MNEYEQNLIEQAKKAAIEVLLHNNQGSFDNLPRTAGWGYPEPYTRDLLISSLGVLAAQNETLLKSLKIVLETLAKNQGRLGSIPSLVHTSKETGASDTTPLFLMAVGIYRKVFRRKHFLNDAVEKALKWMEYQSPSERVLVGQLPTSDWRDEQWVLGYGLYVNTIVYAYLRFFGLNATADELRDELSKFAIMDCSEKNDERLALKRDEGLVLKYKPYYAMWSYKVYKSERFDLLGNSLAILTGIASKSRAKDLIAWIEQECENLKSRQHLGIDLPPCLFPYIQPKDSDWIDRYKNFNQPGDYHNGGIWPFVCGFYIAALVAAGRHKLAEKKLIALTYLIKTAADKKLQFGFNEWYKAQSAKPGGQDWQSWSAAMYLYAANCVRNKNTPFFNSIRKL